jgi:hypothetical protein
MTIPRKRMPDRLEQFPVHHGDFVIRPVVTPAEADPHRWEARVEIARGRETARMRQYDARRSFAGMEEAEEYAVEFDKKIIDGHFPDYSPP